MVTNREATFQQNIEAEILKSEGLRSKILFAVFTLGFLNWVILYLFFEERFKAGIGFDFPFLLLISVLGFGIAYEGIVLKVQGYLKKRKKPLPLFARFANALIETSLPGLVILVFVHKYTNPILSIHSPLPNLFFIFILLSVLRMEFGLSLFTGFIAGAEFFALGLYSIARSTPDSNFLFLYSYLPLVMRTTTYILTGVIAGLVGHRLRNSIKESVHLVEERNEVVGMFGQYVSPAVVDRLMNQKSGMLAENKHVCVMFLDIRNFTQFSEKRSPTEVIDYLNTLFQDLIEIVNRNNGIINKFLGDGFMAVFGAPLSDSGKDVQNAVNASLEILRKIEDLNHSKKIPETKIGIGLHAGEAMTGNVGSTERKEYTIIGDTVNLASRVEQLNKEFGTVLLVTESVYNDSKDFLSAHELPPVNVKGREESVRIYKVE
ncbi:adenylate cyclase [Leptospira perolatii]|uniref:Adenylate cyclase n=1 Tax=Leptospira perolatii TaxID=2023191 RepID=A0A2M9ZQH4_9LEPT|nr:adenylate/guanylate cyclase domain-containing protein [Leptospira perolatii]PJZ68314.1 adenylate cyclase [Leptospira perolatii]PJZ74219.1 adenylate cyclase [Leptospira perolatii]